MQVLVSIAGSGTGRQYPLMGVLQALREAIKWIDSFDTDAENLWCLLEDGGTQVKQFEGENASLGVIIMRQRGES